jgi:methyl-accepting chemotaxis protein
MRIWHKILVAPAVAILFLLTFGVVAYLVVQRQAASLDEIATTRRAGVEAATDAAQKVSESHAGVYRLFTGRTAMTDEQAKQAQDAVADKLDGVQGYLTGFRAQPHVSDEERKHLDAVLGKLSEYRKLVDEAVAGSTSASGAALMMRAPDQTFQAMLQDLAALAAFEKRLAERSHEEATAASQQAIWLLFALLAVATVASIAIALMASRAIVRPLQSAIASAARIADGDLSEEIRVRGKDETAQLLQALATMAANLRALVGDVAAGAHMVADTSGQIAQGNVDLSQRTDEQASTLEQTASSMEELTATVAQNAQNARQASELAVEASQLADRGGDAMGRAVATMGGIADSSRRIGDIIGVIEGIAFQTNILALNAAVEAARAGDQGRGFAVVATEVRALAQRSAVAAKEIKVLIDTSVDRVGQGAKIVDAAGATMRDVVESVRKVSALIAEIAAASQEQSAGIGQVNISVSHMEQVVQQNAALVEEAAAATESMNAQAAALLKLIERFRLDGAAPTEPVVVTPDSAGALPAASATRLTWA